MIGRDLDYAAALLRAGEVVGMPTETVYGLAGNAFDPAAVEKIYQVKGRPRQNPLILHTHAMAEVARFVKEVPPLAKQLATEFWPGPLTLLLPKKDLVPSVVTAGHDRVAVRVPQHPLALALLRRVPFPLVAPSANPSNYVSPTTAQHVIDQLGDHVKYVLDGGAAACGVESTIVGFNEDQPVIYRLGGIPIEMLEACCGAAISLYRPLAAATDVVTPGQLPVHYAPHTPLMVSDASQQRADLQGKRIGVINFRSYDDRFPQEVQRVLSPSGALTEAAHHLFAALRSLDQLQLDLIIVPRFPEEGLGRTLNERLARASTPRN